MADVKSIKSKTKNISIYFLLSIVIISGIYLPQLVHQGLFFDGMCYASISRNMSLGEGSLWKPYYSSSVFWNQGSIERENIDVFYEHLPFMFFIQSFFFKVLGDHFIVEKLYSLLVLFGILILISKLHHSVRNYTKDHRFHWLSCLLYLSFPLAIKTASNNMLDSTVALFSIASSYFIIRAVIEKKYLVIFSILAGISLLMSFFTKGLVSLFPLVIPIFYLIVFRGNKSIFTIKIFVITSIVFLCGIILILINQDAREFVSHYLDQQFVPSLSGERGNKSLYIVNKFVLNFVPLVLIFVFFLFHKANRLKIKSIITSKQFIFISLIAISASFPLFFIPKQFGFYLIPSMPYYAILFAFLFEDIMISVSWIGKLMNSFTSRIALVALGVILLVNCINQYGKISSDNFFTKLGIIHTVKPETLEDIISFSNYVPPNLQIGASRNVFDSGWTHTQIVRYMKCHPTNDSIYTTAYIIIRKNELDEMHTNLERNKYVPQNLDTNELVLFKRNVTL